MPYAPMAIQQRVLRHALSGSSLTGARVELEDKIRGIIARGMSSLVANDETPMILEPGQVTLELAIADGVHRSLSPEVAAVLQIWAFDYPSRNGEYGENFESLSFEIKRMVADHSLVRPMDERLREIQSEIRQLLMTDMHIEVNFVPQQKGHWVGG